MGIMSLELKEDEKWIFFSLRLFPLIYNYWRSYPLVSSPPLFTERCLINIILWNKACPEDVEV